MDNNFTGPAALPERKAPAAFDQANVGPDLAAKARQCEKHADLIRELLQNNQRD